MIKRCSLSKSPQRILVIAMRHLGDVLLSTPLISSLHQAYPDAEIDLLAYKNTAPILNGNPDLHEIIVVSNKPNRSESFALIKKIFRHYDLAVVTQTGDRPMLYSLLAAPIRIALTPDKQTKGWWKRYTASGWAEFDDINTHTVLQNLQLMDTLQQPKCFRLTPPIPAHLTPPLPVKDYAVLHTYPLWTYKQWTTQGWKQAAEYLLSQGIDVVLSGGPAKDELEYVKRLHRQLPQSVINLAGKTSLSQLSALITESILYIGPDTGTTHLAAATGTPTIAVFGPSNPVKWTPWPTGYKSEINPFKSTGNQHVGNVYLIQGKGDCVPCRLEGCDNHRQSRSKCLDNLSFEDIKSAIDDILLARKNHLVKQ